MSAIRFFISLGVLGLLCWLGHTHGTITPQVPAIGAFFSPFDGFWQQATSQRHSSSTQLYSYENVKGEVVFDERSVPHIFAEDDYSAAFLQGYLHAKDRLWQMDISVRATEGRLAEVLGANVAERDVLQRKKGIRVAAQRGLAVYQQHEPTKQLLSGYAAGVNAYITSLSSAEYPLEYKLLGYKPEPWTPLKSILFSKSMAESLCARHRDLESTTTRALLGDSLFQSLYPEHNPKQSPIIPAGTTWSFDPVPVATTPPSIEESLSFLPFEQAPEGIGSNNWAVAGSKTASGSPLLANDPHLNLTLPSIWYEIQIKTPERNYYGVSLPGLPGILIGFNEHSAWGITNGGHDVLDWYRISWTDSERTHYWLDGEAIEPEWITDTIFIRHEEPRTIRIPWTHFGPVVYDDSTDHRYNLAMRWVSHDVPFDISGNSVQVFQQLGTNTQLKAYRAAISGFDNPMSNIVYANTDGDIALTVTGHLPIRADQQGRFVQAGDKRSYNWQQYVPFQHLPFVANPERGFVASANQHSTDPSYPYYYHAGFDDYRGRYINSQLANIEAATPEDMMQLQLDPTLLKAKDLLPALTEALADKDLSPTEQGAWKALRAWDYKCSASATEPVLFKVFLDSLYRYTFDEVYALQDANNAILYPETWRLIDLLDNDPAHAIFDIQSTPERETSGDILYQAFKEAVATAPDEDWNTFRGTSIRHLARIPGLGSGLLTSDGARDTPLALSSGFGPSWRMVVSLEKPVKAWGVLPGGASGNPGNANYVAGIDEWCTGKYFELAFLHSTEEAKGWDKVVFE